MRCLCAHFLLVGLVAVSLTARYSVALAYDTSYFPTAAGSSWNFNAQRWSANNGSPTLVAGTEAVTVEADGRFKSIISLNNNTITAFTTYEACGGSLCVPSTRITDISVTLFPVPGLPPFPLTTTTISDSTYSPSELWFPSSLTSGYGETRTSTHATQVSISVNGASPNISNHSSSQEVSMSVFPVESVTVLAGTFQAVKIIETIQNSEGGTTTTTTVEEWFAPGVGLVQMIASTNDMVPGQTTITQTRELTSYSVTVPVNRQLTVSISGTGTVTSIPTGINCANGSQNGCAAPFEQNSTVALTATPPWYSTVAWGNCTVDTNNIKICSVSMNADKSVSSAFTVIATPVLVVGDKGYDSLFTANQTVANLTKDCTILVRDGYSSSQPETLLFNTSYTINLSGGVAADWVSTTGNLSTYAGTLTIRNGKLIANRIRLST